VVGVRCLQDGGGARRWAGIGSEGRMVVVGIACDGGVVCAGVGQCYYDDAGVGPGVLLLVLRWLVVVVAVVIVGGLEAFGPCLVLASAALRRSGPARRCCSSPGCCACRCSHSGSSPSLPSCLVVAIWLVSSLSALMCLIVSFVVLVIAIPLFYLNTKCVMYDLKTK
jgi:hypothetical protein